MPLETISVRLAIIDDFDILLNLNHDFRIEESGYGRGSTYSSWINWPLTKDAKKYCTETISTGNVIVGQIGDKLIGYLAFNPNCNVEGDLVEIESLFVNESYRRRGIGTNLVKYFMEIVQRNYKNIRGLTVKHFVSNEDSKKFYEKMGFYPDKIEMRCNLNINLEEHNS